MEQPRFTNGITVEQPLFTNGITVEQPHFINRVINSLLINTTHRNESSVRHLHRQPGVTRGNDGFGREGEMRGRAEYRRKHYVQHRDPEEHVRPNKGSRSGRASSADNRNDQVVRLN